MYKALSDPFLGMTSLVQKGGADGRLLQVDNVKMVYLKALCYFQFPGDPGPYGRELSLMQPPSYCSLSDLTQKESLSTHTHPSYRKPAVTIRDFGVTHSLI